MYLWKVIYTRHDTVDGIYEMKEAYYVAEKEEQIRPLITKHWNSDKKPKPRMLVSEVTHLERKQFISDIYSEGA